MDWSAVAGVWTALVSGVSSLAVIYNVVVCAAFIVVFAREPWRRSWFGQSVMILAVALLTFSILALLVEVLGPDYPLRDEVRLFGRLLVAAAMTQRLVVLVRLRRGDSSR